MDKDTKILIFIVILAFVAFLLIFGYNIYSMIKVVRIVPSDSSLMTDTDNILRTDLPNNNTDSNLYYFYSPHCPHCTNFNPEWQKIIDNYSKNNNLILKSVDTSQSSNHDKLQYYNVKKIPKIILVTNNQILEYNGDRKSDAIINFIDQNLDY
jgi:thioredoxin-like negative regulator of GroEL